MTDTDALRLPPRFLASLSDRCGRAGPDAVSALRESGRDLGEGLIGELADVHDPADAKPGTFWEGVGELLAERGLGELTFSVPEPSLAELRLRGGPEAGSDGSSGGRGCPFTTGLLAGLLTAAADEPVAVLEVGCRADGDEDCRWLAGAESALEAVRASLEDGASVREAMGAS